MPKSRKSPRRKARDTRIATAQRAAKPSHPPLRPNPGRPGATQTRGGRPFLIPERTKGR